MSISNIGIANLALTVLSTSRITAFDDENDENARKMNAIFEQTRDTLLTEHNWNFARAQRSLSLLAEEPVVGDFAYVFQLPTDCLRVIRAENDDEFMVISNKVYANSNPLKVEYISRVTDPSKFSQGFIRAFAARLAADLCYGITVNASLTQMIEKKADAELRTAKQSDAQEGVGTRIIHSQLITARQR